MTNETQPERGFWIPRMGVNEEHVTQAKSELDRLIAHCGGTQTALAEKLDISRQAVHKWVKRGYISASTAATVAEIAEFKSAGFSRESLRPDVAIWYL